MDAPEIPVPILGQPEHPPLNWKLLTVNPMGSFDLPGVPRAAIGQVMAEAKRTGTWLETPDGSLINPEHVVAFQCLGPA
jgi:hypothetical protein